MRKRTIIAISILLTGVGGAAWLVFGNTTNAGGLNVSISEAGENTDARFANTNNGTLTSMDGENATDNAIHAYGLEILRLNPRGQGIDKPVTLPSDEVLKNIIAQETDKLIQVNTFKERDINVLKTSSRENKLAYVNAVTTSLTQDMRPLKSGFYAAVAELVANKNSNNLDEHINKIGTHIGNLLAIPVPYEWTTLHLEMLNLWQRRLTYAKIILNGDSDQLKLIAALNQIPALQTDEESFFLVFQEYVKKLK